MPDDDFDQLDYISIKLLGPSALVYEADGQVLLFEVINQKQTDTSDEFSCIFINSPLQPEIRPAI